MGSQRGEHYLGTETTTTDIHIYLVCTLERKTNQVVNRKSLVNSACFGIVLGMFFNTCFLGWVGLPRWHSGKLSPCHCRRYKIYRFDPWGRKMPCRRKLQPTPVFLPGKSHGQRSLVGCSPWGHKELDTTEQERLPRIPMQRNTGKQQNGKD